MFIFLKYSIYSRCKSWQTISVLIKGTFSQRYSEEWQCNVRKPRNMELKVNTNQWLVTGRPAKIKSKLTFPCIYTCIHHRSLHVTSHPTPQHTHLDIRSFFMFLHSITCQCHRNHGLHYILLLNPLCSNCFLYYNVDLSRTTSLLLYIYLFK